MSEVRVNKISPRSGTTVTLGDNGDTITIPSGVTLDASSGGLAGTLTTAAQPNITSVGTLTSFTSTGIDDNATSTSITINSSGNVGIGESNPGNNLVVDGGANTTIRVQNDTPYYGDFQATTTGIQIRTVGSYPLILNTNQTERMRILHTGNVGIGTSSPTEVLHVVGDILATGGDFKSDANNYLGFSNDTFARFVINDSEKMRINSNGNIGIGTSNSTTAKVYINHEGDVDDNGLYVYSNIGQTVPLVRVIQDGAGSTAPAVYIRNDDADGIALHLYKGSSGVTPNSYANTLFIESSSNTGLTIASGTSSYSSIYFANSTDNDIARIEVVHSDNSMRFTNNAAERMRINSSGQTLIGTTVAPDNANTKLMVHTPISSSSLNVIEMSHNTNGANKAGAALGLSIGNGGEATNAASLLFKTASGGSLGERMRIDSFGNVLVGKTVTTGTVTGCIISPEGYGLFTRPASTVLVANRQSDDGTVIGIFQAGTEEGTISVSGTTVSYNGFTGTHWSRFQDNSTPTILRGTVLETLDEMCDWYNLEFDVITQDENGNDVTTPEKIPHVLTDTESNGDVITYNHEGTDVQATIVKEGDVKHMMSKVSDNSDAKNVYGVFVAYDLDGEGYNDFYVASVGSFVVRIKANETIAKGDLLQSNGDGTAKVQTDDAVRSSSFAKVLSTTIIETYEDGSYLVPCSLMC
jgi:hypothetical protein